MTAPEPLELLRTAEAATDDAARAYRDRAMATAEPVDWAAVTELAAARQHIGAALLGALRAEA